MADMTWTAPTGLAKDITVSVRIPRIVSLRIWLGALLMRLGVRVAGCRLEVERFDDMGANDV